MAKLRKAVVIEQDQFGLLSILFRWKCPHCGEEWNSVQPMNGMIVLTCMSCEKQSEVVLGSKEEMWNLNNLRFEKMGGVVLAVVQHYITKDVLMVGVMTPEAVRITMESGNTTFWSRTRKKLWTKGETSGNFLKVKEIFVDCDADTLLIMADPMGPTCHTGAKTCFLEPDGSKRFFRKCMITAIDKRQTGHQTLWVKWECPRCKKRWEGLAFPDDDEIEYNCSDCGKEVFVVL